MEATYTEIPVGLAGRYHVERTHNGRKDYLGYAESPDHTATMDFGTAVAAVKILERHHGVFGCVFRPWPADGLPMKPVGRFA